MRKLGLVAAVAAATFVSVPAADAHPTYHFAGVGCVATAVSVAYSNTPNWTVSIDMAAVATDAATSAPALVDITVECNFRVNGTWGGVVATAYSPLTAVVGHVSVPLTAGFDDTVDICSWVEPGGDTGHLECRPVTFLHPDETGCSVLPGDDVKVGDKIVYDCPPYGG